MNAQKIAPGTPEEKTSTGRPKRKQEDNIKTDLQKT